MPSQRRVLAAACLLSLVLPAGCRDGGGKGPPQESPFTLDTLRYTPPGSYLVIHLGRMPVPEDNPITRQGMELGRRLFHDPILSGNRTQSCATCHQQHTAFADARRVSLGSEFDSGSFNAPALANIAWSLPQFWDGRAEGLEQQALNPVRNPIEMNLSWTEAMARLNAHPDYPRLFKKAFNVETIDSMHVVKAIAQFERTLISQNSRWDKANRGEVELTEVEKRGFELFDSEIGDCMHCHSVSGHFTDYDFHNNGVDFDVRNTGRGVVTGKTSDFGKWKTPSLRNVAVTAPYMHDGRFATLEEVLRHYQAVHSGEKETAPNLAAVLGARQDGQLKGVIRPLTGQDMADIIAFLHTLTDEEFLQNPDFTDPGVAAQ